MLKPGVLLRLLFDGLLFGVSGFWNLELMLMPIGVPNKGCKKAAEGVLLLPNEGLVK